jgi:hypothetical protein
MSVFASRETMCAEPTCPGADIGVLIDSNGPTYLYGTNSVRKTRFPASEITICQDRLGTNTKGGSEREVFCFAAQEHHVETSYRFDGASNVFFLMGQNEFRTFGPTGASSAMCTSNAMQVVDSSNIHVYGVSACSWKCLGPGTADPLISVRNTTDVSFTGMYAACVKDSRCARTQQAAALNTIV